MHGRHAKKDACRKEHMHERMHAFVVIKESGWINFIHLGEILINLLHIYIPVMSNDLDYIKIFSSL